MITSIISFVGSSNSGKTSLIGKLIPELISDGLKIGIMKHTSGTFNLDIRGKDSYKHKKCGAEIVVLVSSKSTFIIKNTPSDHIMDNLDQFNEIDLIIAEGFKNGCQPKIEVHRSDINKELISSNDPNLVAIVSDNVFPNVPVSQFRFNEIDKITNFIKENLDVWGVCKK